MAKLRHEQFTSVVIRALWNFFKQKASLGILSIRDPLAKLLKESEKWQEPERPKLPVYAIATDLYRRGPVVFTEEETIPEHLNKFIYSSKPWPACLPSSLVPLIFPPLKISANGSDLLCSDGAIAEELPLMSPFLKWYRDRYNAPEQTEKRIKIFYLDFANHFSKTRLRNISGRIPLNLVKVAVEVIDILVSRPKYNFLAVAEEMPNVEVLGARFDVGNASLFDANQIPTIISAAKSIFADQLIEIEHRLQEQREENPNLLGKIQTNESTEVKVLS